MAETALNFGPDWIRALAAGSTSDGPPAAMAMPRYKLAEYRYGREEMLALIPKDLPVPEMVKRFEHLAKNNFQIPLALTPMSEDEQCLWSSRYVNSEASLRGKTGPGGYGMNRLGRGGSVDRGRGRGRGGYYQRGLVHDDMPDGPPFSRQKTIERSLSANEKDHRWDERGDRRYDRTFSGRGGIDDTNLKHDNMRGQNEHWRKYDKDDEGDWRTTGSRSYDKLGGRGSWRNSSDRERRDLPDRSNPQNRNTGAINRGGSGPLPRHSSSWKEDSQGNLPEWSVEEVAEPDTVGTFDSSGAFLETKTSENNASLEEIYASDDADEGTTKRDTPEAKKESSKKTPKKPTAKPSANKKNSKSPNETSKSFEETPARNASEPSKSTSKSTPGKSKENATQPSTVPKQPSPQKDLVSSPSKKQAAPVDTAKSTKVESVLLKNSENAITSEEDGFAYHQKATENMVAQWTEEIEQRVAPQTDNSHPSHPEKDSKWFYQDPQGEIQGPFASHEMLEWFSSGYFTMSLMVRRNCDETFSQLGDLIKSWGRVPFMAGSCPPPVRVNSLPSSLPIQPPMTPNLASAAAASVQMPKPDEQLLALQQQLFQQQLMQQQLMLRQAQMQQILSQLKQTDNFSSLNSQQQQQVLMQQFMAQMPRPNLKPMGDQSSLLDAMNPLAHPLLGLPLPPVMKNDMSMWQTNPEAGAWAANVNTSQPPGGSIWDVDLTKQSSETSELDKQKKLLEEQERIRKSEELRLQQEREMEEKRKQEDLRRKQEEEEERKKSEEFRRQEAERQLKEELKRLEEMRKEEERQRQEEFKRQEELRKQEQARKQEELRRQEEKRRQDEEKRQEELRIKEELKKQEELKRQQDLKKMEEKKKKDEIQKKQLEREREKQLEIERQKEALRQKELEREERLLREKREREEIELRKLAELKIKTQGPVWGIQKAQNNSETSLSLADIQRIQEEKERQEKEEKMRQQLLQQQVVKQVQVNKNGLTWAKRANDCTPVVKSLSEIQQEEAERLAQLSRMQKPQAPAPPVNSNAGVWGNSSHLNKITSAPSGWNGANHISTTGFWDDALNSTPQVRKQQQPTPKSSDNAFPSLVIPSKPAAVNNSKSKARAKKEEDAVTRLFGSHHKPTDEFTKWCTEAISSMPSSVDIPTFIAFLKDIESPYEVHDYVKSYFGEGKEPKEFAKLFLEKRSKFRNQAKQAPAEDNTLWGPAPAITPTVNKPSIPATNDNDGNSGARGKAKKKKGRMQKLDSSMLGFTVQSNPDRVNAGEIDHIENNM